MHRLRQSQQSEGREAGSLPEDERRDVSDAGGLQNRRLPTPRPRLRSTTEQDVPIDMPCDAPGGVDDCCSARQVRGVLSQGHRMG